MLRATPVRLAATLAAAVAPAALTSAALAQVGPSFFVEPVAEPAPPTIGDASVELSVGAGAQSADGDGAGGFGIAHARGIAQYARVAPPVTQRGLNGCNESGRECVWFYTGLERDQIDGAGVSADATLLASSTGGFEDAASFRVDAWAGWSGWKLSVRGELQPEGGLRDRFWRSGRGIVQRNIRVDVPPMWGLGDSGAQFFVGAGHVDLGQRTAIEATARDAGFDRDFTFTGFSLRTRRVTFDGFEFHYLEYGVAERRDADVTYGTSAAVFGVELARIAVQVPGSLELVARGGVSAHAVLSPFELRGTSEVSEGPTSFEGTYWLEARREEGPSSLSLGGGSWTRLDPSGHAVDHGWLTAASVEQRGPWLGLRAEAQLGRLRRVLVGDYAPADIAPEGTRAWMGRGSLEASLALGRSLRLVAETWLERSDRDDPRWSAPSTGRVATHAGGSVSAAWRFERGQGRDGARAR